LIYGIGIDIQCISQISKMLISQKERFLQRIFTEKEIAYCTKHQLASQHLAGRWAVKEAFYKAMGTGISGGYRFIDIETINLASGKPHVILYGKVQEDCKEIGLKVFVSISHSEEYAVGQIVLSHEDEES
jgi:holo-[acyl-carrier protein] synthase